MRPYLLLPYWGNKKVAWSYNSLKWASPRWKKREKLRVIHENLMLIIDELAAQSGFNSAPPENLYSKAREIITELESRIEDSPDPKVNKETLRQGKWELFEKLMPSEAKKHLKKFKFHPEKDNPDEEEDEFDSWIKELDDEGVC